MLKGKNILLGVTGSIAAYKSALLVRLLVKEGASVKVIMTSDAKAFITPLTLATLCKNPVFTDFSNPETGEWYNHVELGLWADAFIIAPATANTIAKMAGGICDNLLLTTYLSAKCPVFIAPAMDLDMYKHKATLNNIKTLGSFGNIIIPSESGELASGLFGEGRMAEPEHIFSFINRYFEENLPLKGKRILVTAGPTYENIDPVRFIGNYSTGKMGFAIAEELALQGANVELVSGPTHLNLSHPLINRVDVTSAQEMYDAATQVFSMCDAAILSAAVADYKPAETMEQKIKKGEDSRSIDLVPTHDILAELGRKKKSAQTLVGFALETNNELEYALDKIKRKNLDFIVLNSLNDVGAGFRHDTNKVTIIDKHNKIATFELKEKREVAKDIVKTCLLS